MKGKHTVKISDKRVKYSFELLRNITVVRGNSGTGKTTLFDMISAYARLKDKSSVQLSCDKECVVLRADTDWKVMLQNYKDSIVFIDEESEYLSSREFAEAIKHTDNYYVIFTRENLHNLPYSVDEIYEIHTSGKQHTFRKIYRKQPSCRYTVSNGKQKKTDFTEIVTEDSASGFAFYQHYFDGTEIRCTSTGGNSSIYSWLIENKDKKVFVVADGAAFGSEMNRVMSLQAHHPNITICLPESFEWMTLQSGLIQTEGLQQVLESPSDFVESSKYFSWEQFFTDYLVQSTKGEYNSYSKTKLSKFYTVRSNMEKIAAVIGIEVGKINI